MQISERVKLVGSGELGFQTSHPLDCNVFLLDGGTEHALIDAGSGVEPERIVANVERAVVPTDRVKRLLLTHAHGDHAAGARVFRDRLEHRLVRGLPQFADPKSRAPQTASCVTNVRGADNLGLH